LQGDWRQVRGEFDRQEAEAARRAIQQESFERAKQRFDAAHPVPTTGPAKLTPAPINLTPAATWWSSLFTDVAEAARQEQADLRQAGGDPAEIMRLERTIIDATDCIAMILSLHDGSLTSPDQIYAHAAALAEKLPDYVTDDEFLAGLPANIQDAISQIKEGAMDGQEACYDEPDANDHRSGYRDPEPW